MEKLDYAGFKNQLIELYSKNIKSFDESYDSFSLGYILQDFTSFLLFESISEYGFLESIQIRNKAHLKKVVAKTSYTQKYDFFVSYMKEHEKYDLFALKDEGDFENNNLEKILKDALNQQRMISVVTIKDEYVLIGKLIGFDTNSVDILLYNDDTQTVENKQHLLLQDVMSIDIRSVENLLLDNYLNKNEMNLK